MAADFGLKPADPSGRSRSAKGAGTNVAFPLTAPRQVGLASLKVTARRRQPVRRRAAAAAGAALPHAPGAVALRHAARRGQARDDVRGPGEAATTRRGSTSRWWSPSTRSSSTRCCRRCPTWSDYPYECTEQTLNRFVSTGIVSQVFRDHPAVAKMAEDFSRARDAARDVRRRGSQPQAGARGDALARRGAGRTAAPGSRTAHQRARSQDRGAPSATTALAKLRRRRRRSGGFPWFPGGPPSPVHDALHHVRASPGRPSSASTCRRTW